MQTKGITIPRTCHEIDTFSPAYSAVITTVRYWSTCKSTSVFGVDRKLHHRGTTLEHMLICKLWHYTKEHKPWPQTLPLAILSTLRGMMGNLRGWRAKTNQDRTWSTLRPIPHQQPAAPNWTLHRQPCAPPRVSGGPSLQGDNSVLDAPITRSSKARSGFSIREHRARIEGVATG